MSLSFGSQRLRPFIHPLEELGINTTLTANLFLKPKQAIELEVQEAEELLEGAEELLEDADTKTELEEAKKTIEAAQRTIDFGPSRIQDVRATWYKIIGAFALDNIKRLAPQEGVTLTESQQKDREARIDKLWKNLSKIPDPTEERLYDPTHARKQRKAFDSLMEKYPELSPQQELDRYPKKEKKIVQVRQELAERRVAMLKAVVERKEGVVALLKNVKIDLIDAIEVANSRMAMEIPEPREVDPTYLPGEKRLFQKTIIVDGTHTIKDDGTSIWEGKNRKPVICLLIEPGESLNSVLKGLDLRYPKAQEMLRVVGGGDSTTGATFPLFRKDGITHEMYKSYNLRYYATLDKPTPGARLLLLSAYTHTYSETVNEEVVERQNTWFAIEGEVLGWEKLQEVKKEEPKKASVAKAKKPPLKKATSTKPKTATPKKK